MNNDNRDTTNRGNSKSKSPGLLVAMPNPATASELWLTRMNESLDGSLAAIATYLPTGCVETHVPAIDLAPRGARLAQRFGVPLAPFGFGCRALREAIDRDDVQAVLCHYASFALAHAKAWEQSSKPIFVYCHGYDVTWSLRSPRWPHLRRFRSSYLPCLRELAQRVTFIANSHFTRGRMLDSGFPPDRVLVQHLGVPVAAETPRRSIESPTNGDDVKFLYLGRLVDFKGPDLTIAAFDLACRRGLRGTLTLAGDGPLRRHCERLRRASPFAARIKLLG